MMKNKQLGFSLIELMIATNDDTTKWQDGQEKEFLALCAEHPHTKSSMFINSQSIVFLGTCN
jgi:hypothetical protein